MIEFQKSDKPGPGLWWAEPYGLDYEAVCIGCPKCGKSGALTDHRIGGDGRVAPSIVCPFPPCDFHEWGQLIGWEPDKVQRVPDAGGS